MTVEKLPERSREHIHVLNPLRAFVAISVVMFHYSGSALPTINPNFLTEPLAMGHYRVHVFFVISGLIMPYTMHRSGNALSDGWMFMRKRFVRIAPAAYVAACMMILFHLLGTWITGTPVDADDWPGLNTRSILGNLFFHPELFKSQWFNFPYWTLKIEFQFYLIIAMVLPFIVDPLYQWRTNIISCPLSMSAISSTMLGSSL